MRGTFKVGRRRAALGVAGVLALAHFAGAAASAEAASTTVAGLGKGAGRVAQPSGVAVDQETGDLYVADRGNFRIDKFGSGGDFRLAWGYGVADGVSEELQVCGPAAETPTKRCFAPNFFATNHSLLPEAVAVEQSTHDVYVGEQYDVSKFTAVGQLIYRVGRNVNKTKQAEAGATQAEKNFCAVASGDTCGIGESGTGPGEFSAGVEHPVLPLAFDSEGKLWVGDEGRLERFDSGGSFLEEVSLPAGSRHTALAIDPTSDDFYVLGPTGRNEAQEIQATKSTGGEYTLSFEGQTTAALPGDASSAEIQAALEALPTVGPGNVSVARSLDAEGHEELNFPAIVTFIHDLGGRDVPQMTASGGSPAVTISTGRQGNPGSVEKLDPTGAPIEALDDEPGRLPQALAIDSVGNLYVGDAGLPYRFLRFDSTGALASTFGAGQVSANIFGNGGPSGNALGLDESTGGLYAANPSDDTVKRYSLPEPGPFPENQHVEDLLPTTVTLAADLNPEGHETTYFFEYGTSESYGQSTPIETLAAKGFDPNSVKAELDGLIPDTTYHFRLVATDHGNPSCIEEKCIVRGEDTTFTTRTAIGIEDQWAGDIAAHDITLNARLDPLGTAATWWLEYDTLPYEQDEVPHGVHVDGGPLPASFGEIPVAVSLRGLEASTTYYYRFVASDKRDEVTYTTFGEGRFFTTQSAVLGFTLPDDRAWEMVSPPTKHGGRIASPDPAQGGQVQAAADGEALAYLSYGSLEANPEGNRLIEQSSELARRGSGGAWSTVDITAPHTTVTPIGPGLGLEYKLFSADLAIALLQPRDATPLSPDTTERTPYLRENRQPPAYTPLITASEVPSGTEFGKVGPEADEQVKGNVEVRGASPDFQHVVLGSKVPLAKEANVGSLYEWSAGSLEPISVEPGKAKAVQAQLGSGAGSTIGAVSRDGSRVFWTSGGLYLRDTTRDETLRLDEVQPGGFGLGKAAPLYQGANPQGTVAFFTDTQNLTEDANEEGADLYRWQAQGTGGCEEVGGCLTDLTAQVFNFGEAAEVLGLLPGIAEDGSRVYLVARGVLATNLGAALNPATGEPEHAVPGQPNLYTWHEGEGVRFVTMLAEDDEHDWGLCSVCSAAFASNLTAAPSPSGRYLGFMSQLPLTGYDNRDASSGERAQEVFRYDAVDDELVCVSCNPSGSRPRALVPVGYGPEEALDPQHLWIGEPVAALLPEATAISVGGASLYRPRAVQNDGSIFFNAVDSLVPADSNGAGDVYEYEPTGAGTCTASAGGAGTAVKPGGCVSLLSSGQAEGATAFIDASESGSDVFFYSPGRLSVTDVDSEMDVYDARVNGEPAHLEPTAECLGEACQPPAVPPESQTPASAAFRGPGNVRKAPQGRRHCPNGRRKVKRKGKTRCVQRAPKHSTHRRRHHRNGRAHR